MDTALLRAVNALAEIPTLASIGRFLSSPWVLVATSLVLGIVLVRRRRFAAIVSIILAAGASDAVNARIVKPLVARERPCRAVPDLVRAAPCGPGKSFASGHAAVGFAIAAAASPTIRHGWIALVPLAAMVSLSRILLGVHYPSDVIGGAALGSILGMLSSLARARLERRRA